MSEPDQQEQSPTADAAARPQHRLRRFWQAALALTLPLLGLAALLLGLLGTGPGTRALLGLVPGLELQGLQGTLLGELRVRDLRYHLDAQQTLHLQQLHWQDLHFDLGPRGRNGARLHLAALEIGTLQLQGRSLDPAPLRLTEQLELPLAVQVERVHIDRIEAEALGDRPLRHLRFGLQLESGHRAEHHLQRLSVHWQQLVLEGGLSLGAAAPLPLLAELELRPQRSPAEENSPEPAGPETTGEDDEDDQEPWELELRAYGPLRNFGLRANLLSRRQKLGIEAQIRPEAALPLSRLDLNTSNLDLSALLAELPRTALSGRLQAQLGDSRPDATPLQIDADLRNALPARIDEHGLPLRRLQLRTSTALQQPQQGRITEFDLQLGSEAAPAGRWQGRGRWALLGPDEQRQLALALDTRVEALQPALLDQRAPQLQVGGPLALTLRQPIDAVPRDSRASVPADPQRQPDEPWPADTDFSAEQSVLGLRADLNGRLLHRPQPPVQLRLHGAVSSTRLLLRTLQASAVQARLQAQGRIEHGRDGSWRAQLQSELQDFDPALWWPGSPDEPWLRQPHRLAGALQADLLLPRQPRTRSETPAAATGIDRLALLQGQLDLQLRPSLLAGLPVAGQLHLAATAPERSAAAPSDTPVQAKLDLQLGAAEAEGSAAGQLHLDGRIDPRQGDDHWQLDWNLPALQQLAPWLQQIEALKVLELQGDTRGSLQLDGRWPALRSQGRLDSARLQWRPDPAPDSARLSLQGLQAQWQAGTAAQDALQLQLQLDSARHGTRRLSALRIDASGRSAAQQLRAALRLEPPAGSAATATPLQLDLQADGGWFGPWPLRPAGATADGGSGDTYGWQGLLQQLTLRESGATAAAALPALPASAAASAAPTTPATGRLLLQAGAVPLRLERQGRQVQAQVGSSKLQLLDATLALQQLHWQRDLAGAPDQLQLQAALEPLAVAPLLARAQPGFGWRGSLQVAGQLRLQSDARGVDAEFDLHRQQGDLLVFDPDNPEAPQQRLGLEELRLQLRAEHGRWQLQQHISGSNLGTLEGRQTVRSAPGAYWPAPDDPVSGQLDLHIARLGQWGRWLPAGWRLSGQLDSQLRIGGRFGAPDLGGELQGRQLGVRNLLQGVDWNEGQLQLRLDGQQARIEQFSVKAGSGRISASGTAQLGEQPTADLRLQAERFALLQRVDRRIVVSGAAQLHVDAELTRLSGTLHADEGRLDLSQSEAPGLGDDVKVQQSDHDAEPAPAAGPARGKPRRTEIQLRAELGEAFELRGRGLQTRLGGALDLGNATGKLSLHGDLRTEDGQYAAYGQKLAIDRGLISFDGVADNPRLDIVALRPDLDEVRVGVAISGTAQNPRVRLFSNPEMGNTDKLSWLLLGRASDGLERTDLALLQRAAYALLSGESDSPSLVQRLGLDELSVRQGDGETRETVVALGKQLSRRWYVGYERNLNAASGAWQLIYRAAQRFTLRAQSSVTDRALDLIWTWKWAPEAEPAAPAPAAPASAAAR